MDSNTHSPRRRQRLAALVAEIDAFPAQDLERLSEAAIAEEVQELRPQIDRLEGQWLKELAWVDARGAAGAEQGVQFGSTAGWLRARLRMAATTATSQVRTARALFCGPLRGSGKALCAGEISAAHAEVLATSTLHVPDQAVADAEATLLDAARRLDPPGLRKVVTHFEYTMDPERADAAAQRRYERRGLWFTVTYDQMVAVRGIMPPEAGQTVITALDLLPAPPTTTTPALVASGPPMPCTSWPVGDWKPASSPSPVGPTPAQRHRRPAQPPPPRRPGGPARQAGWEDGLGRPPGTRGVPAAGL